MATADPARPARDPEFGACDHTIQIPLADDFVFVHEPLRRGAIAGIAAEDDANRSRPLVGRRRELEELLLRLSRSRGGSFLITGYRGVGKTSFVNQVIHELRARLARSSASHGKSRDAVEDVLVDVHLSLARPTDAMGILFHVIHGLHQRLQETELLPRLPADVRSELEVAWQRTSYQIATSRTRSQETEGGIEGTPLFGLTPSLSLKDTRSDQLDLQYLAYDDRAAERDLIRITQRLACGFPARRTFSDRLRFWRRPANELRLKVVLVFDELDKLQEAADAKGATPVDELIAVLKNLLTTSGICFLFIAGKDLEERWQRDIGAGDSIYESVFSFNRYLPALWDDTHDLVKRQVAATDEAALTSAGWRVPQGQDATFVFEDFRNFIAFHGRGIPRRSLRLLHGFVRWSGERCVLAFHRREYRRMRFFAGLEVLLREQRDRLLLVRDEATAPADRDHARLGLYYLVDWMLQQGDASFTATEAVEASRRMSRQIAFVERLAVPAVRELIELLVRKRYLEEPERTILPAVDQNAATEPRYRFTQERLRQLGGAEARATEEALPVAPAPKEESIGRFEPRGLIGVGGFGKVHRAIDPKSGREVAVKVLAADSARSPDVRARFLHEARLLERLNEPGHEGVVRYLEQGATKAGDLYLAMEFVEGTPLRVLMQSRPLEVEEAIAIAAKAASAYGYVHGKGARRLDVKPGNVVVDQSGRVVVMDFGIAVVDGAHAGDGRPPAEKALFVGTPAYAAPEALAGKAIDTRADVYSLGVMLFEMVTGRRPYDEKGDDLSSLVSRILSGPPPRASAFKKDVPPAVDAIVARAMEPRPEDRYGSMQEFADAIASITREVATGTILRAPGPVAPIDPLPLEPEPKFETKFVEFARAGSPSPIMVSPSRSPGPIAPPPPPVPAPPPSLPSAGPSRSGIELSFRRESQDGSTVEESDFSVPVRDGLVIGRGGDCDVKLGTKAVSRRHAVIEAAEGADPQLGPFVVRDLGTANGTFVNGRGVRDPVELRVGDRIQIGDYDLLVSESA